MDVLVITVLVSLALGGGGLLLLVKTVEQGDLEHGDRLSLLPLEGDADPLGAPITNGEATPSTRRLPNSV